ncbi:Transient receptor potential-gamma protein [Eumeta japonica]|uniref:Transient receptor potential-gamma protein n=1 Tax=Eumeta variegata TaxID=151549 RepID=A0A4C1SZ17_EUMVA|nr:Transient receptor potential-gamma protein [Eumeta japonica]
MIDDDPIPFPISQSVPVRPRSLFRSPAPPLSDLAIALDSAIDPAFDVDFLFLQFIAQDRKRKRDWNENQAEIEIETKAKIGIVRGTVTQNRIRKEIKAGIEKRNQELDRELRLSASSVIESKGWARAARRAGGAEATLAPNRRAPRAQGPGDKGRKVTNAKNNFEKNMMASFDCPSYRIAPHTRTVLRSQFSERARDGAGGGGDEASDSGTGTGAGDGTGEGNDMRGGSGSSGGGGRRGSTCRVELGVPGAPPAAASKVKRHSIHGMMEEENVVRPHQEMAQLTLEEKKYLLGVERGDVAGTRRVLQRARETHHINVDCVDPLGRSALLMAIDNENLEMVELLLEYQVETRDALLHAISEEFVEAVEALLDHEERTRKPDEPHSWEALPPETATFTADITPLILAAHRDSYEIIKLLLDRGASLPLPHDVRCGCDECVTSRREDSLRHSRSRINAYRALASPSLIALSSKDPILTAFELSWELRRLSALEHEFKLEYQELRVRCQEFATALLDHTRSSHELRVLLDHEPAAPPPETAPERMRLARLKLAIKLRQKKFVAHPNVQQLLASIWYESVPGFRRKNMLLQAAEMVRIGVMFPFYSLAYIVAPHSSLGRTLRKPFIKFLCHSASYFMFLFLLILASQRIETAPGGLLWGARSPVSRRGAPPSLVEWLILAWVSGLIWSEVKQLWDVGLREYVHDMWNVLDFVTNSLYVATVALRVVSHFQVRREMALGLEWNQPRESWDAWDPMLLSEGLFSAANIFSSLKLVYIFSVNPHLGPLQVSLSRMVLDILKFFVLDILVIFAFSCGLNQLLWYYADLEKKRCRPTGAANGTIPDPDACVVWRRFANLFETMQTLFWAAFGLVDLDSFELDGIKIFTRFWGMLMFGTYCVINVIVLLNLLIAMMNHSYQLISERADVEWKFARSKLWISYFEEGGTAPPPFNVVPSPKSMLYAWRWLQRRLCQHARAKREHMRTIRRKVKQANERDSRYQAIMRNLVRRYVTVQQRRAESGGVTEDDVNEIKQDVSAFRCELVEILRNAGMNTSTAAAGAAPPGGGGGKKNRQKERRLMKGFNIAPGASLAPVDEFLASLHHEIFYSYPEADNALVTSLRLRVPWVLMITGSLVLASSFAFRKCYKKIVFQRSSLEIGQLREPRSPILHITAI